jgi:hypothetical protein
MTYEPVWDWNDEITCVAETPEEEEEEEEAASYTSSFALATMAMLAASMA